MRRAEGPEPALDAAGSDEAQPARTPAPPRPPGRLRQALRRHRGGLFFLGGLAAALLGVALQSRLAPPGQHLTQEDIDGAVLHTLEEGAIPAVLERLAASGLPNLFLPRRECFVKVEQLPLLGSGKLDLREVKRIAADRLTSSA